MRRLRVHAGLGQRDIARALGVSQAKISKIETGGQSPTLPDVRAWLQATGASQEESDELVFLAERLHMAAPSWRDQYRRGMAHKQREVGEIEKSATHLRIFHTEVVPGLLQTAEYARGVFSLLDYGAGDVEPAVAARLGRQQILVDPAKRFEFLVSEAALWWRPGTREMLIAQLDHIAHLAALGNVELHVIPLDSRAVAPHQPFIVYDLDLVVVETTTREPAMRDPDEVAFHIRLFDRLKASAVTGEQAKALLKSIQAALLAKS